MKCIDCLNAERCLDHKEQPSLIGCSSGIPIRKKPTQADHIRSMSDEELADMFHNNGSYVENGEPKLEMWVKEKQIIIDDSFGCILDWLQSEVEV